jgi:hypothetical protein
MTSRAVGGILAGLLLALCLAACESRTADGSTASETLAVVTGPSDDDSGLVAAQHPQCDQGAQILDYLATGDNGGDPGMDQVFASHVGVPQPQARALADQWIESCDQQLDRQAAAASSSAAEVEARASASTASAAASASRAQHEAAVAAEQQRSCAGIDGQARDGICQSSSAGHVTGDPYYPCSALVVQFTEDGMIDQGSYHDTNADHPGCFS